MVVPDFVFDVALFGALIVATVLDSLVPWLHGAATLVVVGTVTYIAAQEMCETMGRRGWWTQESLATALGLSAIGFIYFEGVNDSDLSLLVLSIGLTMASLMVAIALIAAVGASFREKRPSALAGLVLTSVGSVGLGILASFLILVQGNSQGGTSVDWTRLGAIGCALVVWKLREVLRPPYSGVSPVAVGATESAPLSLQGGGRWLIPRRGTLLDRFVPVLILGALLFLTLQQTGHSPLWSVTSPASAYSPIGNHP